MEYAKEVILSLVGLLLALLGWLGRRSVNRLDDDIRSLDSRIKQFESKDIMERPDVLTMYREQKHDMRAGFADLRSEQKDNAARLESQLTSINSQLNELKMFLLRNEARAKASHSE